jgi:hypothetical protein
MKPIEQPETLGVYILASLTNTGNINYHAPTSTSTTYLGYYTNLEDAQQEQMMLALKGQKTHVFHLEFPR